MAVDDECYYPYKQPGSIPFKWEIRPGVPKLNQPSCRPRPQPPPAITTTTPAKRVGSSSLPLKKLKPPPPISFYYPLEEPRTRSFLSAPRTRSFLSSPRTHSQRLVDPPRPEVVAPGCFPSPSKRVVQMSRRSRRVESEFGFNFGPDYGSDLETLTRWSVSSRKSNSSPDSSSWSITTPPVCQTEWAAFNLF